MKETEEKKAVLETNAKLCEDRMDRAFRLINGLADEKERWVESVDKFKLGLLNIVGDILISSGESAAGGICEQREIYLRPANRCNCLPDAVHGRIQEEALRKVDEYGGRTRNPAHAEGQPGEHTRRPDHHSSVADLRPSAGLPQHRERGSCRELQKMATLHRSSGPGE